MIRSLLVFASLAAGSSPALAETPTPVLAFNGFDPVALASGKETPGKESIEASYGRFKYRFANEDNKKAFLDKPDERAIQFGGACGKMGPFSGTGNPTRYHVHAGRIYIFASESCRDAFKKDPEKHIDRPNPVPEGSEDERARGAKLIDRALNGFGGAKAVDATKTLTRVEKIVYKQGGKETVGTGRATWVFPDTVRVEEDYGTPYGHVVKGKSGFELYGKQDWTLEPAMRDDAWRRALREPLVMLRSRQAKGFMAVARGANTVEVSLDGATSTWTLDEKTGRILKAEFLARRGTVGDNAVAYDDFKSVSGLILPHKRTEFFNGKELTVPEKRIESLEVNGDVKADLFVQPK
jgi:YHS domain-containing protein